MLLAHELWARSGTDPAAAELNDEAEAAAIEKASADLRSIWRGMTSSDRDLLTRLARGRGPYSCSDTGRRQSGGVVRASIDRLLDAGEITEVSGGYRMVDPFLAELIRRDWKTEP